jgi:hypothetical protein
MNIALAINGYRSESECNERELLCLKSLRELQGVELYNVNNSETHIDGFETLHLEHHTRFPFVNQIMNTVVDNTSADTTVLFVNSDIIVKQHLIDHLDDKFDTYMGSRVDIELIDGNYKPIEYCVHGFDLFGVSARWWKRNRRIFPDMYLGRPYWDTVYYVLCMQHSNCKIINQHPVSLYHVKHERVWEHVKCEYKTHNEQQVHSIKDFNKWWQYVYGVLLKRPDKNDVKFWVPLMDEQRVADQLFKI